MSSDDTLPQSHPVQQKPIGSFKSLKLLVLLISVFLIALVAGAGGYLLGRRNNQPAPQSQSSPSPQATLIIQPTSIITQPTIIWKTYRNKEYGFTIQYPPEWSVLKSDNDKLEIISMQNIITVSVIDFRSAAGTFQAWVNERPYALIELKGRRALRWYTKGSNINRTEKVLIPSKEKAWAVFIDMAMNDKDASNSNYIRIFDQMIDSLNF
jgi:hypothetical protein